MGPKTAEFEAAFAEHLGAKHAVAVSSCTAALHLAYLAAGVGPGDEVIVPAMTFAATAAAAIYCGATPVFAEIAGPHDLALDPEDVARKITAQDEGRLRRPLRRLSGGGHASCARCAGDPADRGRRPRAVRARRRPGARHVRPRGRVQLLLQQGARVRRGRPARDRRRRRRRARPLAAQPGDDERHLEPPHRRRRRPTTRSGSATTTASTSRAPRCCSRGSSACRRASSAAARSRGATARSSPMRRA